MVQNHVINSRHQVDVYCMAFFSRNYQHIYIQIRKFTQKGTCNPLNFIRKRCAKKVITVLLTLILKSTAIPLYLLNYYHCNSINVQGYILHAVTANCKMPKFKWLTAKSQNLGNCLQISYSCSVEFKCPNS